MFFDANNEPDEIIEGGDNSGGDEATAAIDCNGGDAYMEDLDYGGNDEDSEGDSGGNGFNLGRFVFIALIMLFAAILVGYGIFNWYRAEQYKKLDALEPHSRTYAEFAEVFNELMEPQGITIEEKPMWRPPVINQGLTAISVMTLPDGSQATCGIKLWDPSVKKSHIMRLGIAFSKAQAAYMEPIVRGVFAVFTPEVKQQEDEDFADVLADCQSAFIMQPPYETEEHFIKETAFSMLADGLGLCGALVADRLFQYTAAAWSSCALVIFLISIV